MSFRDIKGQDKAVGFLKGALESGRIAHAYIFFGPEGVGKRLTAMNFAKALNCSRQGYVQLEGTKVFVGNLGSRQGYVQPEGTQIFVENLGGFQDSPCGQCISCKKIDTGNHPDFRLITPEKEGASIKIDAVRSLTKDISLKPYEAKKKVYIIDDASSMKHEAQNALLKTLEEPVSESVLILLTADISRLFSTIRSRAQEVKFFPLAMEEVKDILVNVYKIDALRAHILAHISSGTLGGALRYNKEELFSKRSKLIDAVVKRQFFDWDFDGLSRVELKTYLDIMLTWYRDILIAKTGARDESVFVNIDKKEAILNEAARTDYGRIDNIIKQIISTGIFLDENANPKLAMSVLGLNI